MSSNIDIFNSFPTNFRNLEVLMSFLSNLSYFSNPLHSSLNSFLSSLILRSNGLPGELTKNAIASVLLSMTISVILVIVVALLALKSLCATIALHWKITLFTLVSTVYIYIKREM